MVVGTIEKGISNLAEVIKECSTKGDYGLTIRNAKVVNGVVEKGRYVKETISDACDYHLITESELELWVDKFLENLNEDDTEYCEYDLYDVMSSLKPVINLSEYLNNEYMQLGLDLFIHTVSDAFEKSYIRFIDSDKVCIWFVDMSNY